MGDLLLAPKRSPAQKARKERPELGRLQGNSWAGAADGEAYDVVLKASDIIGKEAQYQSITEVSPIHLTSAFSSSDVGGLVSSSKCSRHLISTCVGRRKGSSRSHEPSFRCQRGARKE